MLILFIDLNNFRNTVEFFTVTNMHCVGAGRVLVRENPSDREVDEERIFIKRSSIPRPNADGSCIKPHLTPEDLEMASRYTAASPFMCLIGGGVVFIGVILLVLVPVIGACSRGKRSDTDSDGYGYHAL